MNDLHHIHDEGLSPTAHAALAALRADDDEMPAAVRERVWARLERPTPIGAAPGRAPWRGVVIGLAIAAGLALALVELGRGAQPIAQAPRGEAARYDGAAVASELAARDGVRPTGEQTAVVAGPTAPELAVAAVPEDTSVRAVPGDRSVRAVPEDRSRRTAAADDAGAADASTLAAEAALLQRAQTALAAGDPEAALARLGEHARGFKEGVLARERDALRVTALCAAGRTAEGRAEGAAFLQAHAGSLLAERVRGACEP